MKLVLISDTHQRHRRLAVPDGDVLIHAGDFTNRGEQHEITEFNEWLMELPHTHKIVIPGNHDRLFQGSEYFAKHALLTEATVLIEEGIEIEGFKFWGSPWTPYFRNWAFNYHPAEAEGHWSKIPADTDVLITHGPPLGIKDLVVEGERSEYVGCPVLRNHVQNRVKPRLHVFGHIHDQEGWVIEDGTLYANAAMVDTYMKVTRTPIVFNL